MGQVIPREVKEANVTEEVIEISCPDCEGRGYRWGTGPDGSQQYPCWSCGGDDRPFSFGSGKQRIRDRRRTPIRRAADRQILDALNEKVQQDLDRKPSERTAALYERDRRLNEPPASNTFVDPLDTSGAVNISGGAPIARPASAAASSSESGRWCGGESRSE